MGWRLPTSDTYFAPILAQTPEGFEIDHLREALKHCTRFGLAVDGGAHIGTWTTHLADVFNDVVAFEPAPDTYECLLDNTKHLGNVACVNKALGSEASVCTVHEDPTRVGNTGARTVKLLPSIKRARVGTYAEARRAVPLAPQAHIVPLDSFDFKQLGFLKLDVEGHEHPALLGAEQTIARCKPTIMVECKRFDPPRNGGPIAVVELLARMGYYCVGGIRNDKVFLPR